MYNVSYNKQNKLEKSLISESEEGKEKLKDSFKFQSINNLKIQQFLT